MFTVPEQRFILQFFKVSKGRYFGILDLALEKQDFTFNGSDFAKVTKRLAPDWIELVEKDGKKGWHLTRNGRELGWHLWRKSLMEDVKEPDNKENE